MCGFVIRDAAVIRSCRSAMVFLRLTDGTMLCAIRFIIRTGRGMAMAMAEAAPAEAITAVAADTQATAVVDIQAAAAAEASVLARPIHLHDSNRVVAAECLTAQERDLNPSTTEAVALKSKIND